MSVTFDSFKTTTFGTKVPARKKLAVTRPEEKLNLDAISAKTKTQIDSFPLAEIVRNRLYIPNQQEVIKASVCECNKINTSTGNDVLVYDPQSGTIDNPLMGTLDENILCGSCAQNINDCPGHYGYIRLDMPMINPNYTKTIQQLFNIFCSCGKSFFSDQVLLKYKNFSVSDKLRVLSDESFLMKRVEKSSNPDHKDCDIRIFTHEKQKSKSSKTSINSYNILWLTPPKKKDSPKYLVTVAEAQKTIINICTHSQTQLRHLGFHSLKDAPIDLTGLILTVIPVVPPCSRPFGGYDSSLTMHPITEAYTRILQRKADLNNPDTGSTIQESEKNLESAKYRLGVEILTLYSVIRESVKGKEGFIRGLSMGKRVDFSGRSVLNPYNTMEFGYVAYPERMRRFHTQPIKVTDHNITALTNRFKQGDVTRVISRDVKINVTSRIIDTHQVRVGDILDLVPISGTETIFNRQPTLDKLSIMGYKAHYVDDPNFLCIGLLSSYTTPHNADFDGDEGNVHCIQTLLARSETRHISAVTSCIMNSKSNKPSMGLVYNSITSAYLFTSDDTTIQAQFYQSFVNILKSKKVPADFDQRLGKINKYSGRAVFSLLFPSDFYYKKGEVQVIKGILTQGTITSEHIGPVEGSIIHYLWKNYGKDRTVTFFTEAQRFLDFFIEYRGFGIGFSSCIPDDPKLIDNIIDGEIRRAKISIKGLGKIDPNASELEKNRHELLTINALNRISNIGKKISIDTIKPLNSMNVMKNSGSKGKDTNIAQIFGCLGQQYIVGARPRKNFTSGTRCSPYFEPNSEDIGARGFISNSFMKGTNPAEFMFHMTASRISMMDTAIKTGEIGHMHHRIVKSLENLTVAYDGSVRDNNNKIYGFNYSDGFSAAEIMTTKSTALGKTLSFIDLSTTITKLNIDAGF